MAVNYEDEWWARIYDSMYWATRQMEHHFYMQQAGSLLQPVLEVACGTGTVLLDLLRSGVDAYGFDISRPMLDMLQRKLPDDGREQLLQRVSRQNMLDFEYPSLRFGTALIPSGSFLFLLNQDEQIACLKNIHGHLRPGGKLIMNFAVPSYEHLVRTARESQSFTDVGDFKDGLSGQTVHVSCERTTELANQLCHSHWRFRSESEVHDAAMCFRWIFLEEFKLLLRLAGFVAWSVTAGFEGKEPAGPGGEAIWTAVKLS